MVREDLVPRLSTAARRLLVATRQNARQGQVVFINAIGIDHRSAAHPVGDDFFLVD